MDSLTSLPVEMLKSLGFSNDWQPPLVLWPVSTALLFWAIFLWARTRERQILARARPLGETTTDFDRGSWLLINYGWRVVRLAAFAAALFTHPLIEGIARNAVFGLGLMAMIGGAFLRQHCLRMLGDHFTYEVKVSEQSEIITHGIYKWVRHPSYTGGMLFNLGIGLALTNWNSIAFIVVGMLVIYFYRVHVEERALIQIHRTDYLNYMQRTKRFVPFLF
jgi:protein-S-isoprenylcysteine O-methyltransferase Ste14